MANITESDLREARAFLLEQWGDNGLRVIEESKKVIPFNGNFSEFLKHCTACGGNWGGMLLTGIRELYPNVWDAIPDNMGVYSFTCICYTLQLCGVNTAE